MPEALINTATKKSQELFFFFSGNSLFLFFCLERNKSAGELMRQYLARKRSVLMFTLEENCLQLR